MSKSYHDMQLHEEALGGLSAGIVGTVIGFPLDLVKTRLQTGSSKLGIVGTASHIVRTEGFLALYKGIGPPLISLSILNTLSFTSYTYFRELYGGISGWDYKNALAGMSGAPLFGLVSTVENLVKTQMQMDNVGEKRFRGSWHCVKVLAKEHGVKVLYTGHVINTIREGAFMSSYFFVYEGLREVLMHTPHVSAGAAIPVAGGMAGAFSWFFSFPLDCVRAGVQGQSLDSEKRVGAVEVFQTLMQTKGIRGLYSGVAPSIARAFLVSGSRFSAYEGALWILRGGRDNRSHH
jgi:solute carrier family 25 carnitine/acylcarnitine transporter 20/29